MQNGPADLVGCLRPCNGGHLGDPRQKHRSPVVGTGLLCDACPCAAVFPVVRSRRPLFSARGVAVSCHRVIGAIESTRGVGRSESFTFLAVDPRGLFAKVSGLRRVADARPRTASSVTDDDVVRRLRSPERKNARFLYADCTLERHRMLIPASDLLQKLESLQDVASFLEVSHEQLKFLLRGREVALRYSSFQVPKRRGGVRNILAPKEDLKYVQRALAERLARIYVPRDAAHGFVSGRSIKSNASLHVRKRYVFNVDLASFFPSINFGRVRGLFLSLGVPEKGATVLAQICCHAGELPQGAPTSPIVSNMICSRMDRRLMRLAKFHNCFCTRYVDDITFSRRAASFPREIGYLDDNGNAVVGESLRQVIEADGFRINRDKVWLYDNKHRQTVTGLTVNAKANVTRRHVRQVRAMIHAWARYGYGLAQQEHNDRYRSHRGTPRGAPAFESVIRGKLEFVKMVKGISDPVYRNLQTQFVRVCPDYLRVMQAEVNSMSNRDVFISHASEDKEAIVRPLTEALIAAGITVWFDEYEIRIGDSLRGKIDEGLACSRFGLLIISPNFCAKGKKWPKRELDGLTAIEDSRGVGRILPVWHEITHAEVTAFSATLAGLKALVTKGMTVSEMASELKRSIK